MAYALVGSAGTVSTGTAGATVTPAYGAGASRTAGNLLILQVMSTGSATLPAAISGWSIAKQQAGTSCSASIYYKVATGADAAPVVPVVASAIHNARLLEFSGGAASAPLDQTAGIAGTATPIVATAGAADALAAELVIASAGTIQSAARANASMAHTINNGVVDTEVSNGATSTVSHYDFSYGTTTGKAAADSDSFAFATAQLTGAVLAIASFKLALTAPVNTVAPVASGGALAGDTASCTQGTWTGNPSPTYGYQWYRGATPLSGAINNTYVTVSGDVGQSITCQVTATNSQGSVTQASNAITPAGAPDETSIDNFNRADGPVYTGGPWATTQVSVSGSTDVRVISNTLGLVTPGGNGEAYTTTLVQGSDCDVLIDCAVPTGAAVNTYLLFLITNPGAIATLSAYQITIVGAINLFLDRLQAGSGTNLVSMGAPTMAAGDTLWFSKRGAVLKLYRKPSGGSYSQIFSVTDPAPYSPASGAVGVQLTDTTTRWDNLRGGPLVGAGPTTHFGVTALPVTFARVVAGSRKTFTALDRPTTFGAVTAGVASAPSVTHFGGTAMAVGFGAVTQGRRRTTGQVALPATFAAVTAAQRKTFGVVARSTSFGAVIAGLRKTFGVVARPVNFSAVVAGVASKPAVTHFGAVSASFSLGAATQGQRKTFGVTAVPAAFGAVTQGRRRTFASTATATTFGAATIGRRTTFGQVARPLTFAVVTAAQRKAFGVVAVPVVLGAVTAAQRKTFGQVVRATTLGAVVAGQRRTFGVVARPTVVGVVVSGVRRTTGVVALPATIGIVTRGFVPGPGPVTYYGEVVRPVTLGAVVAAQRKTFGQVARPTTVFLVSSGVRRTTGMVAVALSYGAITSGKRRTFGQVARPVTIQIVTSGRIPLGGPARLFGQVALPLSLARAVAGQRKTFGQLARPITFGETTTGARKAFSTVTLPITFNGLSRGRVTVLTSLTATFTFKVTTRGDLETYIVLAVKVEDWALTDIVWLGDRALTRALVEDLSQLELTVGAKPIQRSRTEDRPLTTMRSRP